MRKSPTFGLVVKFPKFAEAATVLDESNLRQPSQLEDLAVENRQPFAEILRREIDTPEYCAGLQRGLAQTRFAHSPGAFVEMSVVILQPLRESLRVVRIRFDNLYAEYRDPLLLILEMGNGRKGLRVAGLYRAAAVLAEADEKRRQRHAG